MNEKIIAVALLLVLIVLSVSAYFSISVSEKNVGSQTGIEVQSEKSECSASVSFSLSGNSTCSMTASILSKSCKDKRYEVKNGETDCSGVIGSDAETITCDWTIGIGSYNYTLYVNDEPSGSGVVNCMDNPLESTCANA